MNKSLVLGCFACAICMGAIAQDDSAQGIVSLSAERARIEQTRKDESATLDAQEKACQSRFAVTDCVNEVSKRRRAMVAELKRQEAALHDIERHQRGAEEIQRTQDKASERQAADAQKAASTDPGAQEKRVTEQQEKVQNHIRPAAPPEATRHPKTVPAKTDPRELEARRSAYRRKVDDANRRKAEREKQLKDGAPAKPALPLPP